MSKTITSVVHQPETTRNVTDLCKVFQCLGDPLTVKLFDNIRKNKSRGRDGISSRKYYRRINKLVEIRLIKKSGASKHRLTLLGELVATLTDSIERGIAEKDNLFVVDHLINQREFKIDVERFNHIRNLIQDEGVRNMVLPI